MILHGFHTDMHSPYDPAWFSYRIDMHSPAIHPLRKCSVHVPPALQRAGKATMKRHLEPLLNALCAWISASATAESRARAWAAGDVLSKLRVLVGPSIFRGRLTSEQAAAIASSDAVPKDGWG